MIKIPEVLQKKYNLLLMNSDIALDQYSHCRKWLRYYLDFCKKYTHLPRIRPLMGCYPFSGIALPFRLHSRDYRQQGDKKNISVI